MAWLIIKYAITAIMVVIISETARRSDRLGGLIAALPLVTLLTLIWLHYERQPDEKITNHAWYTFWYVLPTLPMFVLFPQLFRWFGFWGALIAGGAMTLAVFGLLAFIVRRFGIELI
jgi:F0F1-type ATP synthase assembly protein I